ncbi:hypothetical protein BG015_005027, partial [Linnemannia schmuckeri]
PQVALAASGNVSQQLTALSAPASMTPDALMTCKAQTTAITPAPLNGASQSSQANASHVSALNIDAGDVMKTNGSVVFFSDVSIDSSPPAPSGTDTLSEMSCSDKQLHVSPSRSQSLVHMLLESSTPSSFQKDAQTTFTGDDPLTTDTSTMLIQSSVISERQMIDDPASNFEVIDNNGDSIFMVFSNLPDYARLVPNLNAPQLATNSRRTRTTNPRPTKTTNSRPTRATNPRTTRPTSPSRSVKSFSCRYLVCTHPPFTTKWNLKAHMNTHDGVYFPCPDCENVYARYNDRYRHIRISHRGCRWRCEHCQKGHSRKPTGDQLFGCDEDEEGIHSFQEYDPSSAPAFASAAVDAL